MPRGSNPERQSRRVYREMTVVEIRESENADAVKVAFSESARFYRLSRQNPKFRDILRQLREARDKKRPVDVLVDFPEGDVIEDARPASSG